MARPLDGLPHAITLVEGEEIQRGAKGLSLKESLRLVPGLFVADRNNPSQGDRISTRGLGIRAAFGVRGLKVVLDGIPLTMPDGQTQLNNLDLGAAGRIEILRGPSSALYGNASGGLISIRTETAERTPFQFRPRLVIGAHGLRRWQGKFSGGSGEHRYLISFHRLSAEGYREHAAARSHGLNAVGRHHLSPTLELSAVFNLYDAPYLLNPSSLNKEVADEDPRRARSFVKAQGAAKKVRQGQAGLTLRHTPDRDTESTFTIYGLERSLLNPIPGRIVDLDRRGGGLRAVHGRGLRLGRFPLRWTAGLDFDLQRDRRVEHANQGVPDPDIDPEDLFAALQYGILQLDQREEVRGLGSFAAVETALRTDLTLTLGGRYDRYDFQVDDRLLKDGDASGDRLLDQFSPMLSLSYRLGPLLHAYASYATAFQTPTTTELGNRPDAAGGFNPDLEPERIGSVEAGLKGHWLNPRIDGQIALFHFTVTDMLIPYQVEQAGSEEIYYRNAGRARNQGLELALHIGLRRALRATLAYTYNDFSFENYRIESTAGPVQLAGNQVPGLPPHRLVAALEYAHPQGAWIELQGEWVDQYYANDFNGPPPGSDAAPASFLSDAYTTFDASLGLRRNFLGTPTEFFLGMDNLFDTRYSGSIVPNAFGDRFFEPAPGRTWHLGIQTALGR